MLTVTYGRSLCDLVALVRFHRAWKRKGYNVCSHFLLLLRLLVLTGLICYAATGLAGTLAGSLALATASFNSALCHVAGIQCNNMFHFTPFCTRVACREMRTTLVLKKKVDSYLSPQKQGDNL